MIVAVDWQLWSQNASKLVSMRADLILAKAFNARL
jgi:hypothetical protein